MRIHRLRLQAFGPFPGAHELDFDALGASGLHLIHGATGSGKTSVLDAICFAVFGQVAGSRRGLGGPANALAEATTTPEVELEATIAGRRLRFVRRPDHVRPKKRGGGVTTVRSSVTLHEWKHDDWLPVSSRVQEVQHVVDTSLGLRLDQFTQVIMLPQGGFAEFLHAEPDARSGVLRRLFDIERFTDIEQWFTEQRRTAADRLLAARSPLDRARTVVELALADLPAMPALDEDAAVAPHGLDTCPEENLPTLVTQIADQVAARATTAGAQADATEAAASAAQADLVRAGRAATLHAKGRAARAALNKLDDPDTAAARRDTRAELDAAERAARAAPTVRQLRALERDAHAAEQACGTAVPAVFQSDAPAVGSAEPAAYWSAAVERGSHPIRSADERASEIGRSLRQAAEAVEEAEAARQAQHAREKHIERLRTHRADLEAQLAQVTAAGRELETGEELARLIDIAARRARQAHEQAAGERAHAEAVQDTDESVSVATQHAEAQRRAYVDQLTGHLAAELRPGRPCSVCGSIEHPAPAGLPLGELVTQEDVEAAEEAALGTKEAFSAAMADLAGARAAHQHAAAEAELALAAARTAADDLLPGAIEEAPADPRALDGWLHTLRTRTERHVRAAREARTQEQSLTARLEQTGADEAAHAAELVEVRLDLAGMQSRARESATEALTQTGRTREALEAHDECCPCVRTRTTPDEPPWPEGTATDVLTGAGAARDRAERLTEILAGHRQAHERLESQVTAWRRAEQRRIDLADRREETADTVAGLLAQEEFADTEQVERAVRSAAQRERLRDSLEAAERVRTEAQTVLADPDVDAAADADAPDLDALRVTAAAKQSQARVARDEASTLERVRGTLVTAARELSSALTELRPIRTRHDGLEALAAVVNGERGAAGDRRMRLSAYVLAARLEEVVRLANERLGPMTDQRFALEHDDGPGARGSRGGLGLLVHDAWTGSSRPTRSLSGGETFLASLALALGLGDAIQQDAGGRQLETLFVDEGFGSLDDDSLELVLEVLDELRSGGRAVGIVSHVAELRQRIPAQIEVRKSETGSSVHVHLPGRTSSVA